MQHRAYPFKSAAILLLLIGVLLTAAACGGNTGGNTGGQNSDQNNGQNSGQNGGQATSQVAGSERETIYGYIREINEQARTVAIDRVELLTGSDQDRLSQLGLDSSDLRNGYYAYNDGVDYTMFALDEWASLDLSAMDAEYGPGVSGLNNSGAGGAGNSMGSGGINNGQSANSGGGSTGGNSASGTSSGSAGGSTGGSGGTGTGGSMTGVSGAGSASGNNSGTGNSGSTGGSGGSSGGISGAGSANSNISGSGANSSGTGGSGNAGSGNAGSGNAGGMNGSGMNSGLFGGSMGLSGDSGVLGANYDDYARIRGRIANQPDSLYALTLENGRVVAIRDCGDLF